MRLIVLGLCSLALAAPALPGRAASPDLALRRVMLSAAGVGYFEYSGTVVGNAPTGLDVPLGEVDDVLRSLTVFDDRGAIGSIELPGRDSTRQAFGNVPFAQAALNSPKDLLQSLRGEEIAVSGPVAITGRIVSVVEEPLSGRVDMAVPNHGPATATRVTLLTADGFRQFILEDAADIRLTDAGLRARVGAALDAARAQSKADSRHLTLRTEGAGSRSLRVGYVAAAPLWKASYRVVLPAKAGDAARVQGWAVLENQSGVDWKGVDLTLHSGNPVTFHQAIYASYYADRPEVPVEVLHRILPDADLRARQYGESPKAAIGRMFGVGPGGGGVAAGQREALDPAAAAAAPAPPLAMTTRLAGNGAGAAMSSVVQAAAAETAIDTAFHIPTPIDLAEGHSASVPILDQPMPAQLLDWLQAEATRPVSALRITNSASVSLPAGALTLYSVDPQHGAAFAGDARLSGLPAGETRLLAFAEDLRSTATREQSEPPETLLRLSIAKGTMHRVLRHRIVETVTLIAPAREPRDVLVDFTKVPGAAFSAEGGKPSAMEETATCWRVPVSLKPGEVRKLTIYQDSVRAMDDALLPDSGDPDSDTLLEVVSDSSLDPAIRARLAPVFALRDAVSAKKAALQQVTAAQDAANADEERLRNNLRVVTGSGELHDKLLAMLDQDESKLGNLTAARAAAEAALASARASLSDAVGRLDIP